MTTGRAGKPERETGQEAAAEETRPCDKTRSRHCQLSASVVFVSLPVRNNNMRYRDFLCLVHNLSVRIFILSSS